jgi:hypothetical protein
VVVLAGIAVNNYTDAGRQVVELVVPPDYVRLNRQLVAVLRVGLSLTISISPALVVSQEYQVVLILADEIN